MKSSQISNDLLTKSPVTLILGDQSPADSFWYNFAKVVLTIISHFARAHWSDFVVDTSAISVSLSN